MKPSHTKWLQTLANAFIQETGFKGTPYDPIPLNPNTIEDAEHHQFEVWLAKSPVDKIIGLYTSSR